MKRKSASQSAFFASRVVIIFVFCATAVLAGLLAFALYPGGRAFARQNQSGFQASVPMLQRAVVDPATVAAPVPAPVIESRPFFVDGGCPATITESSTQAVTTGNSASCNNGTSHTDNSYWRAFNMTTFVGGQQYNITSVSFGVESANNSQTVTVRLYTNSGGAFPGGTRTQIATQDVTVGPADNNTVKSTNITATVPAGTSELVMELFTPDGTTGSHLFFVGSNTDAQTAPSYLSAASCGVTTPTDTAAIGFPNMHIVFNVNGTCGAGGPSATPSCSPAWAAGPPMPPAGVVRSPGTFFPANGRFYVLGGRSADVAGADFTNPFEYNPATNTWATKAATYPDNKVDNMACGVLTLSGTPQIYCVGGNASQVG